MPKPEPIPGDTVQIARTHGPDASCNARVADGPPGVLTVRTPEPIFMLDDVLKVQLIVPDDARYTMNGTVEGLPKGRVVIRPLAPWARVQQREFVRLRLAATVWAELENRSQAAQPGHRSDPTQVTRWMALQARVLDVSAGGVQLETAEPVRIGERMFIQFSLPDSDDIHAEGTVARVVTDREGQQRVGVRFLQIKPRHESTIQRFIYQQQALQRQRSIR